MIDLKQQLVDVLGDAFGFPVMQQGSLLDDEEYPADFFTFWNSNSSSADFYDNEENSTIWEFELNFYSNDPEHVNKYLLLAKIELKPLGWIIDGKGYDVASDEPTHTGRGINLIYIEKEEKIDG